MHMNLNKYKLIIFDCDGTLVNSEGIINTAFSKVMQDLGYEKFTYEYCMENFSGMSYPNIYKKLQELHPDAPFREIEELFVEEANRLIPTHLKPIQGADKLLAHLHNKMPICVASNGEKEIVKYSLKITNLLKYFQEEDIFTYEDVSEGKPSPELFLHAAKTMGFKPEECLIFEDSVVGLTAAKAAGIDAIAVHSIDAGTHAFNTIKEIKNFEPITIVDDLAQLCCSLED